jgi:hypothetical protein
MTLTEALARDPPRARRFRLLAPLLVLFCLALLAMAPGLLVDFSVHEQEAPAQSIDQFVTYQSR